LATVLVIIVYAFPAAGIIFSVPDLSNSRSSRHTGA